MANSRRDRQHPFSPFNFAVEIRVPGLPDELCAGAFAECDGLEMTMDVKTITEGGNNGRRAPAGRARAATGSSRSSAA